MKLKRARPLTPWTYREMASDCVEERDIYIKLRSPPLEFHDLVLETAYYIDNRSCLSVFRHLSLLSEFTGLEYSSRD